MAKMNFGGLPKPSREVARVELEDGSVVYLRQPSLAGVIAVEEKAQELVARWVTGLTEHGPNAYPWDWAQDGPCPEATATLWRIIGCLEALQCSADGAPVPDEDDYSIHEWLLMAAKAETSFVKLMAEANRLIEKTAGEMKDPNLVSPAEVPSSSPDCSEPTDTPALSSTT